MRKSDSLFTYPHNSQREKKKQKKRKDDYSYSFNQFNPEGTDHLLLKGDILTCYEHPMVHPCRKLMKCPLILAREMSPSNLGYSEHRIINPRRLADAILYGRHGDGYENPRSYIKGRFQRNPLD